MEAALTKHRTILHRADEGVGYVEYRQAAEEGDGPALTSEVKLYAQLVGELGYPETITVTVERGDKLNEEA